MKKQPKLLAHATLRRPFIVTVSAIAAIGAAACGGSTVGVGGGGGGGGGEGEIITNPPPPAACPVAPPSDGEACSADLRARRCGYQDCGGTPSITAECESDGTWHVSQMSCNPPPPPPSCPASQPVDGTACQPGFGKLECGYKDCFGTPAVKATCNSDGTWSVSEHSCNPPPPPPCPTTQPVAGDACNLEMWQECGYKDCFGTPAVTAKCLADKTWSVAERSCNPPPPPQPAP